MEHEKPSGVAAAQAAATDIGYAMQTVENLGFYPRTLPKGYEMTITPQPWISLDERLPEMDERVLIGNATDGWVTVGSRQLTGAYHHWDGDDHEELCEPTHWMPLPEKPVAL